MLNLKAIFLTIGGLFAFIITLIVIFGSFYTVPEQKRAIVTRFGEAIKIEGPGGHWKLPIVDSIVLMPTKVQTVEVAANTYTVDNQEVDVKMTINFLIPTDHLMAIYKTLPDYDARIQSLAVERTKRVLGQFNVQEVPLKRGDIRDKTLALLKKDAETLYGLDIIEVQFTNVEYTSAYKQAVEAAAVAKQNVLKEEEYLKQIDVKAKQAKNQAVGLADAAREAARGEADAITYKATAEAKAIEIKGNAEAKAIDAQAKALKNNPGLVDLRKVERWDGVLPQSVGLGSSIPMIDVGNKLQPRNKKSTAVPEPETETDSEENK